VTEALSTSEELEALRFRYNGQILLPGDPGYDEHRQHFNRRFDKHPAVIARPVNTVDVVATVRYARAVGLEIAISSGGKHMAGFSRTDGGIVIDLSLMRAVKVDPVEQTAWAQAGATGGDLQAEAGRHGLAGVIGWMRSTGIGGVNLHGGFGMVSSKLGWGVDTILEVEMVTADGDVLRVTPDENPDLFWGVRGAAANFGVVTWIKQKLCSVPEQGLIGLLVYDAGQAPAVLKTLDDMLLETSDDLTVYSNYAMIPADPDYPEQLHGKHAFIVTVVHIGDLEAAAEEVRPLREVHSPVMDLLEPQPLYDFMCSMDTYILSNRQWYDYVEVSELSEDILDTVATFAEQLETRGLEGEVILVPHGRGRSPAVPSAVQVGQRGAWAIMPCAYWEDADDDDKNVQWADACTEALQQSEHAADAGYGNVQSRPDLERERRSHGEANWKRLQDLKAKYDPDNVFHLNHNIPPA
jgi:FAD/FMN-containing dehydrogenase